MKLLCVLGGLEEPNLENLKGEADREDGEEKQLDLDNIGNQQW